MSRSRPRRQICVKPHDTSCVSARRLSSTIFDHGAGDGVEHLPAQLQLVSVAARVAAEAARASASRRDWAPAPSEAIPCSSRGSPRVAALDPCGALPPTSPGSELCCGGGPSATSPSGRPSLHGPMAAGGARRPTRAGTRPPGSRSTRRRAPRRRRRSPPPPRTPARRTRRTRRRPPRWISRRRTGSPRRPRRPPADVHDRRTGRPSRGGGPGACPSASRPAPRPRPGLCQCFSQARERALAEGHVVVAEDHHLARAPRVPRRSTPVPHRG